MEKIATDIATFEKVIGEANGTDEPVMARTAVVRTAVVRTAMVRTAAVSAAGAGQGRARYHAAVETTAVRSRAGAGQRRARYHAAVETAAVRRRRRRYGIGQYGARSDFSEAN